MFGCFGSHTPRFCVACELSATSGVRTRSYSTFCVRARRDFLRPLARRDSLRASEAHTGPLWQRVAGVIRRYTDMMLRWSTCSSHCIVREPSHDGEFFRARRLASVPVGCADYPPLCRYSAASGDGNTSRSIGDRVCGGSSARPLAL
jgi:hypothetical protein